MGATCYVVGCKSGYASCKEKVHFFKPKNVKLVKEWEKAIGRKDLKLNKKHSICHKHFEDADIIRGKSLEGKNGPIVYDLSRWKLTDGAVPKLLLGKPVTKIKPPRRVLQRTALSEVTVLRESNISDQHAALKSKIPEKQNINPRDVALPLSWFWQQGSLQKQEFICSKFKWLNENKFEYVKTVIINEDTRTLRYFLRGQQVFHENLKSQFSTISELYIYMKLFDDAQVCIGNPGFSCNAGTFSAKSKFSQTTGQNVVQSNFENNILKESSNLPTKTSSQQQPQATSKFLILQPHNLSKIIDETEKTTSDDTNDITTRQPVPPVEVRSETVCESSPIAESTISRNEHKNLPYIGVVDISQAIPPEDEPTFSLQMPDGAAVSLRYPNEFFHPSISNSKELERKLVKRSCRYAKSSYNLVSYLLETWRLGVYTPFKSDLFPVSFMANQPKVPVIVRQPIANDWSHLQQPTFLIALPQKVYCRRKVISRDPSLKPTVKAALKLANIEKMKSFNGKIHVTLNGESLVQLSISNLFQDESNYYEYQPSPPKVHKKGRSRSLVDDNLTLDVEAKNDIANDQRDLELARRLLKKEGNRKYFLQRQLRLLFEKYTKSKGLARSILLSSNKCQPRNNENRVPELPKSSMIAKKVASLAKCQQCNKTLKVSSMKNHLKSHSGVKSHLCELCGRSFVFKSSLNSHIRINHNGEAKPFMCTICGHTCSRKQLLDDHERIHTNERPFECSICDKRFRTKSTLSTHRRTHSDVKPYSCKICAKSYTQSTSLKKHFGRHHENTGPNGAKNPLIATAKLSYHCEFCQKQFWRLLTYEKHRATHTGEAVAVRCAHPNCDFTYSDTQQLKTHVMTQHPHKAYTCDVCEKIFLAKHSLKDHKILHDSTLGFQCSYCPARLTTKANLISHEKNHTRDTPFECSYCEMRFYSTYMLNIHMRKHHLLGQPKKKRIRKPTGK
ncbi:uncharacterized protein LOC124200448 isoform X2 [Daphnia pulex]|nr:uncharacterized protein LOC124200448 isoform X2 [Daphnia pulex]XP_046452643.1 uncharacterized protein LOC124200448 isoform X2 [Daphnia pulex]